MILKQGKYVLCVCSIKTYIHSLAINYICKVIMYNNKWKTKTYNIISLFYLYSIIYYILNILIKAGGLTPVI